MLKDRKFARFYVLALVIVAVLTCYPVYMGLRVLLDMSNKGYVLVDDYPKYVIPYTPISIAVILGVAVMPLALKLKKFPLLTVSLGALVVFFLLFLHDTTVPLCFQCFWGLFILAGFLCISVHIHSFA